MGVPAGIAGPPPPAPARGVDPSGQLQLVGGPRPSCGQEGDVVLETG